MISARYGLFRPWWTAPIHVGKSRFCAIANKVRLMPASRASRAPPAATTAANRTIKAAHGHPAVSTVSISGATERANRAGPSVPRAAMPTAA
jgi:hypothetical protein